MGQIAVPVPTSNGSLILCVDGALRKIEHTLPLNGQSVFSNTPAK